MEKLIARILEEMIKQISPEMHDYIVDYVKKLEGVAQTTKNTWDDIMVMVLKAVLNIE